MNQIKKISHKNKKYKYIFCDINGLINFFKSDILFVTNFEKLLQDSRDENFKYTEIINENINTYWLEKAQTYYQIIWNPSNLDLITIVRAKVLKKKDNNTKECILSMVNTNIQYRNLQFCQKNISMLKKNLQSINPIKPINKFILYVIKDNIPGIKCYEKCGFTIIELIKNKKYLMETKF
jgi:hypothetical protein